MTKREEYIVRRNIIASALAAFAMAGLAGLTAAGAAAPAAPAGAVPKTVHDLAATAATPKLTLTSTSIKAGEPIADTYSQYGANKSPQLSWTAGPAATKSYVVVAQDPIAGRPAPVQHWIIYDIPATVTGLAEGLAVNAMPPEPKGAMQATAGNVAGYRGPRPPSGQTHTYVFQVFALDIDMLPVDMAKVDAAMLAEAMKGHVLAAGTLSAPYTAK
jgi:Raf kinase inhibitor-like YbhB/YbcL family protein